jgi:hypothetical protein
MTQNRRSTSISTTVLYQVLGITGGGGVAGLLIALRGYFLVGLIVALFCLPGILFSLRELSGRGKWGE